MDPFVLVALADEIGRRFAGAPVERALPVGRTGVHLYFAERPGGIRLVTEPEGGALVWSARHPPPERGGRGVWLDAIGAIDRDLAGHSLLAIRVGLRPVTVELCFVTGASLRLSQSAHSSLIRFLSATQTPHAIPQPPQRWPADPARWVSRAQVERELRERALSPQVGPVSGVSGLLEDLPRRVLAELDARSAARTADALAAESPRVLLRDGAGACVPIEAAARASLSAALKLGLALDGANTLDLAPGVEAWATLAAASERLAARRHAVVRTLGRERVRVDRARAALERERLGAPLAADLRRQADSLLAAQRPTVDASGLLSVPDVYSTTGQMLQIRVEPAGATVPRVADRLYDKARRQERAVLRREDRRAVLERRSEALARQIPPAELADLEPEIAAVEDALRELGIAAGLTSARDGREIAAPVGESGPARSFRSPGGYAVLVGRTARQNDQLTFKIAGPEDLWLHAASYAGAHVVLRVAGRGAVPAADQAFAARLAAFWSKAPRGEAVEVHVARRKHVRRRRGAPPGEVTVRKSAVLRVTAQAPPSEAVEGAPDS